MTKVLESGKTWSESWISNDREIYGKDKNFLEVLDYVNDNDLVQFKNN